MLHVADWFRSTLLGGCLSVAATIAAVAQGTVPDIEPGPSGSPVAIQVDLNKTIGPYKPVYSWFGYDEANYTTMRHGTELL